MFHVQITKNNKTIAVGNQTFSQMTKVLNTVFDEKVATLMINDMVNDGKKQHYAYNGYNIYIQKIKHW